MIRASGNRNRYGRYGQKEERKRGRQKDQTKFVQKPDLASRLAQGQGASTAGHMNLGYVLFMLLLVAVVGIVLIWYLKLQSDLSDTNNQITQLETTLSELKASNDELYNEINDNIDLDAIRDKAINKLGMTYAGKDQIVEYSDDQSDSVHQVTEVGK